MRTNDICNAIMLAAVLIASAMVFSQFCMCMQLQDIDHSVDRAGGRCR